ncbi:hypothetical protein VNO77_28728 [Canavalia gladiata]|uniref:Uncharacterized protein n=1 Tax=Canavalia gladiata TaxID=3824 RepID=A0AAN9KZL1_CANGL
MDTLSRITLLPASYKYNHHLPTTHAFSPFPRAFSSETSTPLVKVSRAGPFSPSVSDADEDVLQMFLKERELNGDFISRACDILWLTKFTSSVDSDIRTLTNNTSQQTQKVIESNSDDGFLKLSRTQEWVGDKSAAINMKVTAKDSSARRKKLNILKYESLKREILLVSVGIGLACSGYCLITLSIQAAISYAIGVGFSFLRSKVNLITFIVGAPMLLRRIGINENLQDLLLRLIMGCSISLSSPRLVIPATIFGLWALSHQHFTDNFFDFQLVPATFGMFVYKAAVLVQVYRHNEEVKLVLQENEDGSRD